MTRIACLLAVSAFVAAADTRLGKPLEVSEPVAVATLMAAPDPSVGKVVQVKGKITEVCGMMGCWMQLVDGKTGLRVTVEDGEIVFPKSAIGKTAIAEGTLNRLQLSREQAIARARHEAAERGTKFDPATVKSGATIYQIQGTGAVILD